MNRVQFEAQGDGARGKSREGEALARMGRSQVLVSYRLRSGEPQERWVSVKRVLAPEGEALAEMVAGLPAYRRVACDGRVKWEPYTKARCPKCGADALKAEHEHSAIVPVKK